MVAPVSSPLVGSLLTPRTRLIGRETERATARAFLLEDAVPLLTLTGPGGVGKTRLALAMAQDVADRFPDGIRFVTLAPLRDPDLVATRLAQTLGLRDAGDEALTARLMAFLREERLLLVLDNFEQVAEGAPFVTDLLGACPRLTALVTSRALLGVSGERTYALAQPAGAAVPLDALLASDPGVAIDLDAWLDG